jgi:MerR family transcriptional regulator, mercuric resistance operon regulatory protein
MEGLTRGQLAQRAQVNPETVRFYEQEGLLAPPLRTASGYRKFADAAVDRLAFVKRAKALGFSLGEIRELVLIQNEHIDVCVEVRDLVARKLAIVREKVAELEKLEVELSTALRKCDRALKRQQPQHEAKACPVLRQMAAPSSRRSL